MNFSTYRFTLDLHKHQSQMSIAVFQYDTAIKLSIGITDGGVPYYLEDGVVAVLFGEKENGEPIAHNCMIEENTRIIYTFNKETANETGVVNCQIRFYKDGEEILAAPKFIIVVGERVVNDTQVFDSGDGAFEEQFSALDNLFTSESARIIAEKARVEAEKERDGNERIREEKELARIEFETQRQTEEAKRVKAEEDRAEGYAKLENKLDKTNEANKIYGTNAKGEQTTFVISLNAMSSTIVQRRENGQIPVLAQPADTTCATSKGYVDGLVNDVTEKQDLLEARVTDLESLTLSYPEITSTDYEKVVPAEVKPNALVKMIGGATAKITGKNELNPIHVQTYDTFSTPIEKTINNDGTISFTLNYTENGFRCSLEIYFDEGSTEDLGKWYYLFEERGDKWLGYTFAGVFACEISMPYDPAIYGDENDGYPEEYTFNVKCMMYKGGSSDTIEFEEAPSNVVFEPYREEMVNAEVERVESIGKNRLSNDVYDIKNWTPEANGKSATYPLDLADGWYCISLKQKEGVANYFYLRMSVDGGAKYVVENNGYRGDGLLTHGYLITSAGIYTNPFWFKVDKKAGILYQLWLHDFSQSRLDQIYDIQIEKVELAQTPSNSYKPSVYAPATAYTPYKAEPIDTIEIPLGFREATNGYGREGSYLECRDGVWYHIVTKDENLNTLPEPIEEEVPVTIPTSIMVEGGGTLRFVSEHKIPVPNTIGYVTRKE